MLALLTRFLPSFRIGGIILAALTVILYIRHTGVEAQQNKDNKAAIADVKRFDKIEKEVSKLSDDELDKRLANRVQ